MHAGSRLLAVVDANAEATPAPTPYGYEGDVASRYNGDGFVFSNDVIVERSFAVASITPQPGTNELQRADVAPYSTLGDGMIGSNDVIVVRNYASGNYPLTPAGGPTEPGEGLQMLSQSADSFENESKASAPSEREIRVHMANGRKGGTVTVPVFMKLEGDEAAVSFTLEYDAAKLTNPRITLGSDLPASAVLTTNTKQTGKIGILVDADQSFSPNPRELRIVFVTFDIRSNAAISSAPIMVTSSLARQSVSDILANLRPARFTNGSVSIAN